MIKILCRAGSMLLPSLSLLSSETASKSGDKYSFGDAMMLLLIATLMIFAILAVLMGVLYLFKLFWLAEKRTIKEKQATQVLPADDASEDEEIVVAVTAAINVYFGSENKTENNISAPFVIKKIKRL